MADALGSPSRPVYLDPFTEVVAWRGAKRFLQISFQIWYRYQIAAINPSDIAVTQSLISYVTTFPWPGTPPFDAPPNSAGTYSAAGVDSITGAPTLPGVSGFTAGFITNSNVNDPGVAVRLLTPPSSIPPPASAPPAPHDGQWGSAVATLEALAVLSLTGEVAFVIASTTINFTGLRAFVGSRTYEAIAASGRPVNTVTRRPDNPFTRYSAGITVLLKEQK